MTDQTETAGARDAVIDLAARVVHEVVSKELGTTPSSTPHITDVVAVQALARRGLLVPVELFDDRAREATPLLRHAAALAARSGKTRTAEWLTACATLPPAEWPPAPAYKGPVVPATEHAQLGARLDAARLNASDAERIADGLRAERDLLLWLHAELDHGVRHALHGLDSELPDDAPLGARVDELHESYLDATRVGGAYLGQAQAATALLVQRTAERDARQTAIDRLGSEIETWTLPVGALQQMSDAVNLVHPVSEEDKDIDVPHTELRARRAMDVVYEWLRGIRAIPAALQGDQPAGAASTQAWTQDRSSEASVQAQPDARTERSGPAPQGIPADSASTVDSREDVAGLPDPNGCRHCGAAERGHYRRYADAVGWHQWTAPDDATRLARMYARRAATHPGGQIWPPGSGPDHTTAFRTPPPAPFVPTAEAFPEVTDG